MRPQHCDSYVYQTCNKKVKNWKKSYKHQRMLALNSSRNQQPIKVTGRDQDVAALTGTVQQLLALAGGFPARAIALGTLVLRAWATGGTH